MEPAARRALQEKECADRIEPVQDELPGWGAAGRPVESAWAVWPEPRGLRPRLVRQKAPAEARLEPGARGRDAEAGPFAPVVPEHPEPEPPAGECWPVEGESACAARDAVSLLQPAPLRAGEQPPALPPREPHGLRCARARFRPWLEQAPPLRGGPSVLRAPVPQPQPRRRWREAYNSPRQSAGVIFPPHPRRSSWSEFSSP